MADASLREVLLVEDNAADIRLAEELFGEAALPVRLTVARDGDEAMRILRRDDGAPPPDLVLLDLNLPRMGGREVLDAMKRDPGLRRVPVVVMSASVARRDVEAAYDGFANAYVPKPVDLDDFRRVIEAIRVFWLDAAQLPARTS